MLPLRILVVDSNTVYAKKVKGIIEQYVHDVEVDVAPDVFVTRRRLTQYHYDLVIADTNMIVGHEMLLEELNKAKVPVIAWSVLNPQEALNDIFNKISYVQKPMVESEMHEKLQPTIASLKSACVTRAW